MSKKNKNKSSKDNNMWADIRIGAFRLSFPKPRLPVMLGATRRLTATNTIYPAYVPLDAVFAPFNLSVAAGALANSQVLDTTTIVSFATRFGSLFREYCIVGARIEIRVNGTTVPQGLVRVWIDEDSAAAPTGPQAQSRGALDIPLTSSPGGMVYTIDWMPYDLLDLDWTDVGTNVTSAWLKSFAGAAYTGTAATTTATLSYSGSIALAFRGYI